MGDKTNTPRCDVAMAKHLKRCMKKDWRCDHIGKVHDNDCWHCLAFIVRYGTDDIHMRFPENIEKRREFIKKAKADTNRLRTEVARNV